VKKHIKRTKEQDGGIVSIEAPLHVSNVQVLDPVSGCVLPLQACASPTEPADPQRRRSHSVPLSSRRL